MAGYSLVNRKRDTDIRKELEVNNDRESKTNSTRKAENPHDNVAYVIYSVDDIGDSEMVFGDMKPRIRHRLPGIHLTVGETLGQNRTRTFSTTRCRHPGCSETKTLGHVLGFCKKGELLRNNRHHRARTAIANLLRNRGWEVHEIHCVSEDDSHRRVDIIAINRRTQKAMVLDPTICFERDTNQALQINDDKRAKYVPCLTTRIPSDPGQLVTHYEGTSAHVLDFGPRFIDIYDVVQRVATRGNPRDDSSDAGVESGAA
ncbi:hypothetical protein ANN_26523 [Periplaneta americana]|uniref:Reverse transcriptase n=1 Tax=Periplaneta americana TaxID=6978 RepID=A0ABQ8RYK3_PERAM|nr:hypothetical protein ANN_26523 [Periplaneta americana]